MRERSRPTVVVADDHARILELVSSLLADDFRVVATVTDGRQALDAAARLDPDAVLLDITMPGLDGFRTAHALREMGSRAKMILLTMHEADEYVEVALASGIHGYVLKTHMEADLPSALCHVLDGRVFVPSLTSLTALNRPAGAHAVHFRSDDASFLDEVGGFLHLAMRQGDMAAVVGTEATRAGIAQRLAAAGCDLSGATARGGYVAVDAADAVSLVMHDGRLDRNRVREIVDGLEHSRLAFANGRPNRLTVFGEMNVHILKDGHTEAAIELEQSWSEFTRTLPFLTVCSYPVRSLAPEERPEVWASVCAEHSAVCHAQHLE